MFFRQEPTPEKNQVINFRNASTNFQKLREVFLTLLAENKINEIEFGMFAYLERQETFSELQAACDDLNMFKNKFLQTAVKPLFFLSSYMDGRLGIDYHLLNFIQELEEHIAKYDLAKAVEARIESPGNF